MIATRSIESGFYIVGGTLRHDAPCYVARLADEDLYDGIARGKFCYVLTSRQIGKSSLMIRTAMRLREEGARVAVLDLTAIGQNLTAEQWYAGLLNQMGQQLDLEDELLEFWQRHPDLGPLHRWMKAIREVVLDERSASLVIFVDEIDAVRSLPFSTDEFFAGIRECYNRRSEDAQLARLSFCLLGVATPSDLIRDTRTTPFNVGQRIELSDFTQVEAAPLAQGLGRADMVGMNLLKRILYWTGGHPYLTQRLCQAAASDTAINNASDIDRLCEKMFFSPHAREMDDNLLFVRERLLRDEADRASLLDLYSHVRNRRRVLDDETNPLVGILRLSGITRAERGYLFVRNRIYERVFDQRWITANMPDAELRRQRAAYRRGLVRATAYAAVILAIVAGLALAAIEQRNLAKEEAERADLNAHEAREALNEVSRQKQFVDEERQKAIEQRTIAEQRQVEAERQRRNAVEQKAIAEQRDLFNRRLLYVAQMNMAEKAWETPNVARVLELLNQQQEDLRGFEWHYLWQLCHNDQATLQLPPGVTAVAFAPDGAKLAAAANKTVKIIAVRQGKEKEVFKGYAEKITSLAFSPDGKWLAAGNENGSTRITEIASGKTISLEGHTGAITCAAFSADSKKIATGSQDETVRVWDIAKGDYISFEEHTHPLTSVAFSPEGKRLATGSQDGTVGLWDMVTGESLSFVHGNVVTSVAFSPDGRQIASGSQDGTVRIWSSDPAQEPLILKAHLTAVTSLMFSPDGKHLATGSSDNTARLWDAATGQELRVLKGHTDEVYSVAFSRDGKQLMTGSSDGTVKTWDVSMEVETPLREHEGYITAIAFSPDGRWLATASYDRTVKLWDVRSGLEAYSLPKQTTAITSVAFSRDGRQLAFASTDTVSLLEMASKKLLTVASDLVQVNCIAFSPSGRLLAVGSDDAEVKLFDVAAKREIAALKGHTGSVSYVEFSPDGRHLASASLDGIAKLWDVASRK
ncbi:MAG TPA: AAA-like domain-containing protein, partial [Blastocatellia bacterium]